MLLGYLVGTINPAALLARIKKINLRERGTKNLGATNTMLAMGKGWGAFVMVFDIAKAFVVSKVAALLFPALVPAGMLAGTAAVFGHVFPFYMKFKGGKGLAAFGGLVLAYNPWFFLILLSIGILLMLFTNQGISLPLSATSLFPFMTAFHARNLAVILLAFVASILVFAMNIKSAGKDIRSKTMKVRDFVRGKK